GKNKEHFDGPRSNAANGGEALQDFSFAELFDFARPGHHAREGFGGQILDRGGFGARQTGASKLLVWRRQNVLRRRKRLPRIQAFHATENGSGGGAIQLLVRNRSHQSLKGSAAGLKLDRAWSNFG